MFKSGEVKLQYMEKIGSFRELNNVYCNYNVVRVYSCTLFAKFSFTVWTFIIKGYTGIPRIEILHNHKPAAKAC